jgi:hypothetical protein
LRHVTSPPLAELIESQAQGGVFVKSVLDQKSPELRRVQPYDRVVAVSASFGDNMWRTNSLEGVSVVKWSPPLGLFTPMMLQLKKFSSSSLSSPSYLRCGSQVVSAVNTRIGPSLKMRFERRPEVARLLSRTVPGPNAEQATLSIVVGEERLRYVQQQMALALRERDHERAISVYKLALERGERTREGFVSLKSGASAKGIDIPAIRESSNSYPVLREYVQQ